MFNLIVRHFEWETGNGTIGADRLFEHTDSALVAKMKNGDEIDFAKLPIAADAQHDSYQPDLSSCLEGTRVDMMEEISRWVNDPAGECFYWLQGKAGAGKSTIAKTLAEALQDLGITEKVFPSDANFLLVRFKHATVVQEKLRTAGILVQDVQALPLCENCLCITVGTAEQNALLIRTIQSIVV
ncbi:MAG: hypothetical protein EOO38_31540 [Cytophagaceae bacterium]|nr:MAG: hypothetical protein EOO38_31540 [Cytophagaceae bacterium]